MACSSCKAAATRAVFRLNVNRSVVSQVTCKTVAPKGSVHPAQTMKRNARMAATSSKVIPSPSYAIPISLAGITALAYVADVKVLAAITGILGVFLAIQASRVKFVFDDEALV